MVKFSELLDEYLDLRDRERDLDRLEAIAASQRRRARMQELRDEMDRYADRVDAATGE